MKINKLDVAIAALLMGVSNAALAQAGGFAGSAVSALTSVSDTLILVVGVVAIIALVWQFAEGFMGRKTWPEVLTTAFWIIAAGAGAAVAKWLFSIGKGMSF